MTETGTPGESGLSALEAALERVCGALLRDPDVDALGLIEGAALVVTRRARRETLPVEIDPSLGEALEAAGARTGPVEAVLSSGASAFAAPLADGRWALRVERPAGGAVRIPALLESRFLAPEIAASLMEDILSGRSLVVTGPCAGGRDRLAVALAHEAQTSMDVVVLAERSIGDVPPAPAGATVEERLERARRLGAVLVLALDVDDDTLGALLSDVAVVVASTGLGAARVSTFDDDVHVLTVGFAPDGAPELKNPSWDEWPEGPVTPVAGLPSPVGPRGAAGQRAPALREVLGGPTRAPGDLAAAPELPPLRPLGEGPPDGWALDSDDADPGWELAEAELPAGHRADGGASERPPEPPVRGDAFLERLREVQRRPTFKPRRPAEHPQARRLRGKDELGGLTLEPPPGGLDDERDP